MTQLVYYKMALYGEIALHLWNFIVILKQTDVVALIKNSTSRLPQVVIEFILHLVCHTDPILHLLQTRYNRYRASRFFFSKKIFLLKMT